MDLTQFVNVEVLY